MSILFEFDPKKSRANFEKHGIDFVDAQRLWEDEEILIVPARSIDESKYLVIGIIDKVHWTGIVTDRRSVIRIISMRRSRQNEKTLYKI